MSTSDKVIRRLPNQVLQEERLQRGWTQQEVANRVGTTVINVSRWERGITSPNPYFRQKLCALFEKDAEALGLFPVKQIPLKQIPPISLIVEDVTSDSLEKELVSAPHAITSLPLRNRLLGARKAILAIIFIALVLFVSGSGFLIHSFLFSRSDPKAQNSPSTVVTSTSILVGNAIAKDTFQRVNQTFWGTASDGLHWREDANNLANFSIANNTAQITTSTGDNYNAILGPGANDAEVLFSASLSKFDDTNLGAVLRWQDTNHWYKALIDGTSLMIQKKINGTPAKQIQSFSFAAKPGLFYTIRFRAVGTHLMAKVWLKGSKEPSDWMVTADDPTFKEGFCGLRIRVRFGAIATVTSFQAISLDRKNALRASMELRNRA